MACDIYTPLLGLGEIRCQLDSDQELHVEMSTGSFMRMRFATIPGLLRLPMKDHSAWTR